MANKKSQAVTSKEVKTPTEPASPPAGQPEEVNPIELKTIETRLNGIKDATKRSRFVFIVMTIIAATILITIWNASLSWDSGIAADKQATAIISGKEAPTTPSPENQAPANGQLRQTIVNEWMRNQLISVGLLGVRVSGTDLSVIGSAGLIVIMTWYFYSQRRENRAIVKLLRHCVKKYEAREIGIDVCSMVFHGIIDSTVFLDVIKGDVPLRGLRDEGGNNKKAFLIRVVLRVLVYLPPVTILLIIYSDVWSLLHPSPIRPGEGILWDSLRRDEVIKVIVFESVALLSAIYTTFLCWRSTKFSKATTETLKDYMVFLKDPNKLKKLTTKHK